MVVDKQMIYFDNAATTPMCEVAKKIMQQDFFNPSSPHSLGLEAERAVKTASKELAKILSCRSEEIIFTSGGTESNNLGILGAVQTLKSARGKDKLLHIIASNYEHPSVIAPLNYLASLQGYKIIYTAPSEIANHICEDTAMICIAQVCSETGDMFEINKIEKPNDVLLFVDGAQGFCKFAPPSAADIYTFSSHKIHGSKGVGGIMAKSKLRPMLYGGGQQSDIRPGTENVAGIVAMTAAVKEFEFARYVEINSIKEIMKSLADELPDVHVNSLQQTSPYILNMSFMGVKGETLTNLLSDGGVYVSMGAACRTSKKESGLELMGFKKERAESAIRLSFSYMNTTEEAYKAKEIIKESITLLRRRRRK